MNNILVTNVVAEDCEVVDVMVFTRLTARTVATAFRIKGDFQFDECYAVPDTDIGYYIWEGCHLTRDQERNALKIIRKADSCSANQSEASSRVVTG